MTIVTWRSCDWRQIYCKQWYSPQQQETSKRKQQHFISDCSKSRLGNHQFCKTEDFLQRFIYTVIVNNSTHINKTNNHLSPQILEHKNSRHMALEIKFVLARLNWIKRSKHSPPPFDNWILNGNTNIDKIF